MLKVIAVPTDAELDTEATERLSLYRKEKISRASNSEVVRERSAAGVLLALALKKYSGLEEQNMKYSENGNGKPYFPEYPNVCFNITHTKGLCAVALSDREVGIDAETESGRAFPKGAVRCFSEREREWYGLDDSEDVSGFAPEDKERSVRFLRLWTAKESAVKCTGRGIAEGFLETEIPYFESRLSLDGMNFSVCRAGKYIITVCAKSNEYADFLFLENLKTF